MKLHFHKIYPVILGLSCECLEVIVSFQQPLETNRGIKYPLGPIYDIDSYLNKNLNASFAQKNDKRRK